MRQQPRSRLTQCHVSFSTACLHIVLLMAMLLLSCALWVFCVRVLLHVVHVMTFTNTLMYFIMNYYRYTCVTLTRSSDLFFPPGAAASSSVKGRRVPRGTNEPKYPSAYFHCTADVSLSMETHLQLEIFKANTYSTYGGRARMLSFLTVQGHPDRTVGPLHSLNLPLHPDIPLFMYFNVFTDVCPYEQPVSRGQSPYITS